MSALDDLERQLYASVDAGAAAPNGAPEPRTLSPGSSMRARRRRWSSPRLFALAIVVTGTASGALAATGVLRVTTRETPNDLGIPMRPGIGVGVRVGAVTTLPGRVADPAGGPPWVLRSYRTSRGSFCLQAGQLYRGRFGRVTHELGTGATVFALTPVQSTGVTTRCTGSHSGRFPVISGLRAVDVIGGVGDPRRCAPASGRASACPITAVTVIRFGMLGPDAVATRWVERGRPTGAERRVDAAHGGAYLYVRRVDPTAWQRYDALEREITREADARFPRSHLAGASAEDRRREARRWRARIAFVQRRYGEVRAERRRLGGEMLGADGVLGRFAGGQEFIVSGRGARHGRLPGVVRSALRVPAEASAPVTAFHDVARGELVVSFRAPVTLARNGWAYRVTARGPKAPACGRHDVSVERYVDRDTPSGTSVRVRLRPSWDGGATWCPGAHYSVRVRLSVAAGGGGKPIERDVGRASVQIRR